MSAGGAGNWQKVVAAGDSVRRRIRPAVVLVTILVVVVATGVAIWANAILTPVHRVGEPRVTIGATPSVSSSPTPTPTPSPTPTGSATPTTAKPITVKSSGKFTTATLIVNAAGSSGTLRTYAVRTETSSGLNANKVAGQIAAVLNDPRSWAGSGSVRFALVADPAKASFVITLAAPGTAAKSCTIASGTCLIGAEVVVDAEAWRNIATTYAGNAGSWQGYLVNHGVGALLGKKPATCAKKAKPAPVMMAQQVDLGGCAPNPWPYP